jgi:hypothetical protein
LRLPSALPSQKIESMKNILLVSALMMLSACSHTINFRANHFAAPIVGDDQWSGHAAVAGTSTTNVTVVNNYTSNPPIRTSVEINKDIGAADVLMINNVGFDASLSIVKSLELYVDSSFLGARLQFLNHGSQSESWVATIQGAYGTKDKTSSESDANSTVTASAKSEVKSTQAGLSIGYKTSGVVPYISYLHEVHDVKTTITNNATAFGPYSDHGVHDYFSVGLTTSGKGFKAAIEYSMININWDRADKAYQNAFGGKIGVAW